MVRCECVTACTVLGERGVPRHYSPGEPLTVSDESECPSHFEVVSAPEDPQKEPTSPPVEPLGKPLEEPPEEVAVEETGLPEFTSKAEIEAYAKKHFQVDLDKRKTPENMLADLEKLRAGESL
jgi:hypothetical protein